MNRFYIDTPLATGETITLSETVFHHWCRVLRAQVDDHAILFNGLGGEYTAKLIEVNKKTASVFIENFNSNNRTPIIRTTLGQVMSKGDRMDYAIQKATELGVHSIQLLTSERCEMRLKYDRDQKKIDHWQSIAIAACEQCAMNIVPKILAPMTLQDWVIQAESELKLVMALSQQKIPFPSSAPASTSILIGPEGGLTQNEITHANQHGFLSWTIGERILRTETAPIAALSILNTMY